MRASRTASESAIHRRTAGCADEPVSRFLIEDLTLAFNGNEPPFEKAVLLRRGDPGDASYSLTAGDRLFEGISELKKPVGCIDKVELREALPAGSSRPPAVRFFFLGPAVVAGRPVEVGLFEVERPDGGGSIVEDDEEVGVWMATQDRPGEPVATA